MPDKYELKAYELSRVRYFDGAYLKDEEFIDEQKYHIDRRQRHDRLLHVSGICEGLEVSLVNSTTIKVTAGTAIDSLGRTILLEADKTLAVTPAHHGQLFVQIVFQEKLDVPADQNGVEGSHTRFTQDPVLSLTSTATSTSVVLGAVSIISGNAAVVTVDGRTYSGLRLPGPGSAGYELRARADQAAGSRFADLNCSLSIQGSLEIRDGVTVKGNVTAAGVSITEKLSVTGNSTFTGSLSVTEAIGIGTTNPQAPLHVTGDVVLGSPNFNQRFIIHPRAHQSMGGDFLHITHDNVSGGWEWGSGISIHRNGNVGIGTSSPTSKLTVVGTGIQISGNGTYSNDGRLMIGPWLVQSSSDATGTNSALQFYCGNRLVMQITSHHDRLLIYQGINGNAPYFYFNQNGAYGVYNPAGRF